MLSFAADFWPLFWTIIGGGALVTVLLSLLVGTFSPQSPEVTMLRAICACTASTSSISDGGERMQPR